MNQYLSRSSRWSAYALIAASLLLLFALMHHPGVSSHTAQSLQDALATYRVATGTMHGIALALLLVIIAAIADLCRRWGFGSPLVVLGFVFFVFGMLATMVAGTIDGFLIVSFLDSNVLTMPANATFLAILVAQWAVAIQVATKIGIAAISLGMLFFGLELIPARATRLLGSLTLSLAVAEIVALIFAGTLAPKTIVFATLPFVLWLLLTGVAALRAPVAAAGSDKEAAALNSLREAGSP